MKKISIVTGASSGMGKDFVYAVDKEFPVDEIWVIARREDRLAALQADCKQKIVPVVLDLGKEENLHALRDKLAKEAEAAGELEISCLVNAAGFGVFGEFEKQDMDELMDIVDLNSKSLMAVCHMALPYMKSGDKIINLGSNGSWQPVPYENVYASTKSFVLNFSRALNQELRPRGIQVLCVCPDWVRTEFLDIAIRDNTINYFDHWYDSKDVVDWAMKDLKKGKIVSILGFPVRLQVFLIKLLPNQFIMNTWCKQQGKM